MAGASLALVTSVAVTAEPRPLGHEPADQRLEPQPPVGLYVHVPFCVSICPYCDFVVYAGAAARGSRSRVSAFVQALLVEIGLRADDLEARFGRPGDGDRRPLDTVYLGGGTPSLLSAETLAQVLTTIAVRFGLAPDAEVTLEANPGPDERGDAAGQRDAGVTRLSIGAQSADAVELSRLGRRHNPGHVAEAVADARAAGIGSINVDLLYDAPGQTLGSWIDSLEAMLDLGPDHLSLYALTLDDPTAEGLAGPTGDHLPTTAGARRWRSAARPEQDDDRAAAMYHHAIVRLDELGYRGYEISNWALPGHESRHNFAYWQCRSVEGVGPGAHAFDGAQRRWNAARLDGYLEALTPLAGGSPTLPPGGSEEVDPAIDRTDRMILGLRTADGIPTTWALEPPLLDQLDWALAAELLEEAGNRLRLTTRGRLLSNELFARLV